MKRFLSIVLSLAIFQSTIQTLCMDQSQRSISQKATIIPALNRFDYNLIQKKLSSPAQLGNKDIVNILMWSFWRISKITERAVNDPLDCLTLETQFESKYISFAHACLDELFKRKRFDLACNTRVDNNTLFIEKNHPRLKIACLTSMNKDNCALCNLIAQASLAKNMDARNREIAQTLQQKALSNLDYGFIQDQLKQPQNIYDYNLKSILCWSFYKLLCLTLTQDNKSVKSKTQKKAWQKFYIGLADTCLQETYTRKTFHLTHDPTLIKDANYMYHYHYPCAHYEGCDLCRISGRLMGQVKLATKQCETKASKPRQHKSTEQRRPNGSTTKNQ